jgi:hypothetical protein
MHEVLGAIGLYLGVRANNGMGTLEEDSSATVLWGDRDFENKVLLHKIRLGRCTGHLR